MKDPFHANGESTTAAETWFERHPAIARLFHGFMLLLLGVIVFCIGGSLLFLRVAGNSKFALTMTSSGAWLSFGIGGTLAVGWLAWICRRKGRRPTI